MALNPGARLGPYEIAAQIGTGGMGEVYRATDTNLKRQVAIKVLPEALAGDADRLARFQREAEVLASLNHPNIAAIYGIEAGPPSPDDGFGGGGPAPEMLALVLELVEGPTLADRIVQGPVPIAEALAIAKQIADALEAAHEQGIVHRDLKPANVKIRPNGTVKVLDFGLAKSLRPAADVPVDASRSPTIAAPVQTQAGIILGTAAYMAPEQARGRPTNERTDIWAFGCVLYEMLTGRPAFGGETLTDTLAAVIEREPDWARLRQDVPAPLRTLLRRCLEKDPAQRLPHIGSARLDLAESSTAAIPGPRLAARSAWLVRSVVAVAALAVASLFWIASRTGESPVAPAPVSRVSVNPSPGETWVISPHDPDFAVSPDGQQIAYVGQREGASRLIVRRLDQFEGRDLGSFGGALRHPFFSPDGEWVAFVDGNTLKKIPAAGGPAELLCELPDYMSGAAWGSDGYIVFGGWFGGLHRVPDSGGQPEPLATGDPPTGSQRWPVVLPDARAVLYAEDAGFGTVASSVRARSRASGDVTTLVDNATFPRYAPTGHLLYVSEGALWAVRFDADALRVDGDPVRILDGVLVKGVTSQLGAADVGIGANGTLVYRPVVAAGASTLVWVDRQGREEPLGFPPQRYARPVLSPDGSALAVEVVGEAGEASIWVGNVGGAGLTSLASPPGRHFYPLWAPDGRRVVFGSEREGKFTVSVKAVDGRAAEQPLIDADAIRVPSFITPGGNVGYAVLPRPGTAGQLREVSLDGDDRGLDVVTGPVPALSPDGRWLAYSSQETGDFEIYVQPFPNPGRTTWRVSPAGGRDPEWSPDGRELFYQSGTTMYAMDIATDPVFAAGPPSALFEGPYVDANGRWYDIGPDGRFLLLKAGWLSSGQDAPLNVVLNWHQELIQLLPPR